jgi:predicted PurR-regulated permease PerM
MRDLDDRAFLLLLAAVSLAFAWILRPFFGAVLWGIILAIVFAPLHHRLARGMRQRRSLAALATVLIIVLMVVLPLVLIAVSLLQQASGVYASLEAGELDYGRYFQQVFGALPPWAADLLDRVGLTNLGAVMERVSAGLMKASQFLAARALTIGQNTLNFVVSLFIMLYLLFFLLRDGDELFGLVRKAVPLRPEQQHALFEKFTVVVRATIKGNIVVALLQGALGGLIFWFFGIGAPLLWGVLMAFLSLLPAVGTALVWLPVAIYFLVTGALWQGVILIAYGVFVIGLVDNVVRPILVGKDTKMPDYVVLISTLGGIALFGINGFVVGPLIAAMFLAAWSIFSASRSGQTE